MVTNPATPVALITYTNHIVIPLDANLLGSDTNEVVPPINFRNMPLDEAFKQLANVAQPGRVGGVLKSSLISQKYIETNNAQARLYSLPRRLGLGLGVVGGWVVGGAGGVGLGWGVGVGEKCHCQTGHRRVVRGI